MKERKEMKMSSQNTINIPVSDSSNIYEGGGLMQISITDLKDNVIAIRQLINSHNQIATDIKKKENEIQDTKAQNEYLKTSPFIAIISAIINIIGSVLMALGVNLLTDTVKASSDIIILILGILLVVLGSLANILYPKAREWFNPVKKEMNFDNSNILDFSAHKK